MQGRLNNFAGSSRCDRHRDFTPVAARDIDDRGDFLKGMEALFVGAHKQFGRLRWIKRDPEFVLKLVQNLMLGEGV